MKMPTSMKTTLNFQDADDSVRVKDTYAANYARLAEVKAKYDPDNFFHVNHTIAPAGHRVEEAPAAPSEAAPA